LLFGPDELRALIEKTWWYELYIPPGYLESASTGCRCIKTSLFTY